MASPLQNYIFVILLLAIIQFKAISSSSHHHNHHHLKSLHFSLFLHDTMNKTGYTIVNGIETGVGITVTTAPFGTLYVFQDPLTVKVNRSSKLVGISEGASITSSFDGLHSLSIVKMTLNLKHHKGTISIVGAAHNVKRTDLPVVGGTEDFMFVQGYVTSYLVYSKGLTVVIKLEFHLYWPPYAIQSS